jgi:hypothetical protein
MSRRLYALIGLVAVVLCSVATQAADRISIPGSGVNLAAVLFTPAGTGPFATVIGLHGCGGVYASDGTLSARHAVWAERLVGFDYPNLPVHTRSGLAYTSDRSGIADAGTNTSAREDALRRVTAFMLE